MKHVFPHVCRLEHLFDWHKHSEAVDSVAPGGPLGWSILMFFFFALVWFGFWFGFWFLDFVSLIGGFGLVLVLSLVLSFAFCCPFLLFDLFAGLLFLLAFVEFYNWFQDVMDKSVGLHCSLSTFIQKTG